MKAKLYTVFCILLLFIASGCQGTKTRAVEGGVIGGLIGATAGGIIGHQSHSGAQGAAIGAAVGAVTGAVIGSQIEKPGESAPAASTSAVNPNQMSIQQIVELTQQGIHEAVIIDKIRMTNSRFSLTEEEIAYLRQQGVSETVIDVMQGQQ